MLAFARAWAIEHVRNWVSRCVCVSNLVLMLYFADQSQAYKPVCREALASTYLPIFFPLLVLLFTWAPSKLFLLLNSCDGGTEHHRVQSGRERGSSPGVCRSTATRCSAESSGSHPLNNSQNCFRLPACQCLLPVANVVVWPFNRGRQ